jgi:hypothetical protein
MKTNKLNPCVKAALLALGLSAMQSATADIYFDNTVFLNTAPSATEVYALTCPIGTTKVKAQVGNKLGGVAEFVSVQIVTPNGRALSANSRENVPSPVIETSASSGIHLVTVHKSEGIFIEPYDLFLDCFKRAKDAQGKFVDVEIQGTQSTLVYNQ